MINIETTYARLKLRNPFIVGSSGLTNSIKIIKETKEWMKTKNYASISDFRGKMSYLNIKNPALFEISQFMKHFSSTN